MFKALLTIFFVLLVAYVIMTISRSLKGGRQAVTRFYIFLFVVVVLALILLHYI